MPIQQEYIPYLYAPSKPRVRLHLHESSQTYFGESQMGAPSKTRQSRMNAEFTEVVYYVNHLHLSATVVRRDGIRVPVASDYNANRNGFVICRHITVRGNTLKKMLNETNNFYRTSTMEMLAIREAAAHLDESTYFHPIQVLMEYFISGDDLQRLGGTVYHYQTDTVVSVLPTAEVHDHPYSHQFQCIGPFGEINDYKNHPDLNIRVRLVDHGLNAQPRYINLLGRVFKLIPQRDSPFHAVMTKDDKGNRVRKIYDNYVQVIYCAKNDPNVKDDKGLISQRYTFKEAKELLGMTDTLLEAADEERSKRLHVTQMAQLTRDTEIVRANAAREKAHADREHESIRAELAKKNQELEELKIEGQRQAHLQKQQSMEYEAIQAKLDHERKCNESRRKEMELEFETLHKSLERQYRLQEVAMKNKFENQSYARKNSAELLKFTIAALTLMLPLILTAQSKKTKA